MRYVKYDEVMRFSFKSSQNAALYLVQDMKLRIQCFTIIYPIHTDPLPPLPVSNSFMLFFIIIIFQLLKIPFRIHPLVMLWSISKCEY